MTSLRSLFGDKITFIGGILTAEIIRRIWRHYRKSVSKLESDGKQVHDVIFFPDAGIACKDFFENVEGCSKRKCTFSHEPTGLWKLLSYIKLARKSIDICVFCISCHELVESVIQRHKVGVSVRVITDHEMEETAAGSQSHRLMKDGIIVRRKKSQYFMHHKYAIIDKKILIIGSFNWTTQAITGNFESLLVTSDEWAVKPFCEQFDKLWEHMKPHA